MPQQTTSDSKSNGQARRKMNNKPVHVVRYGAIKAAVWENQTANGTMHNVTLRRSYKDGEEWKESDSLGTDDLLPAGKALSEAHSWIHAERQRQRAADSAENQSNSGSNEDSTEGS
jgi:hypothetical protein